MNFGKLASQYFLGEIKSIDELYEKFNQELYIEIMKGVAMNIDVDLKNVREFVTSDTFTSFLTSKTTDFGTAAFILQTVLEKLDDIERPKISTCQYYKVREDDLLDLLEKAARFAVLEQDGVDNYEWYMDSKVECFAQWYECSEEEAYEMGFDDAAKLDITQYERI